MSLALRCLNDRSSRDRHARDDRVVEQGRLAVFVELLRVPQPSRLFLRREEVRKPDRLLAGAQRAKVEVVVAEGEADAVVQWA